MKLCFFQIPHPLYARENAKAWGVVSDTGEVSDIPQKELQFDEVFGDTKLHVCGIRFNCVKPTIPRKWQCKGVGHPPSLYQPEPPTANKTFVIVVKPTTTTSTTTIATTATTTRGIEHRSNCTEKSDSDQLMKRMKIDKIVIISVSAFSGILLVIVITFSICYSKRKCKKTKVTINEPKKQTRNSTWYDLDITRASRQSSTEDIEQPPFEYKSVIVMQ